MEFMSSKVKPHPMNMNATETNYSKLVAKHGSLTRNGDWAMHKEYAQRKEDEESWSADLYYLPTGKRVKSTLYMEPTTMKPHGSTMNFDSTDPNILLEETFLSSTCEYVVERIVLESLLQNKS